MPEIPIEDVIELLKSEGYSIPSYPKGITIELPESFSPEELYEIVMEKPHLVIRKTVDNYGYYILFLQGEYIGNIVEKKKRKWVKIPEYSDIKCQDLNSLKDYLEDTEKGIKKTDELFKDITKFDRPSRKEKEEAEKYLGHLIFGDDKQ